jgi:hypothetical protein
MTTEFKLGEIVVFESGFRFQTFISQIREIHLEYPYLCPYRKATPEEKKLWYESGEREVVIEEWITNLSF